MRICNATGRVQPLGVCIRDILREHPRTLLREIEIEMSARHERQAIMASYGQILEARSLLCRSPSGHAGIIRRHYASLISYFGITTDEVVCTHGRSHSLTRITMFQFLQGFGRQGGPQPAF